ncbi:vWA domain-containing protein [Mesobacillus selenatarsenatis]|uniref:D-amino acid dehydrogenase large subunit n=1 Tax=Mesobacillus selenatarsenatis (strain DSM 18680 / JCM 14380 / FERM P-15431 / SF-1) TaxID=1321606 RepID=A0A0A8X452_MESS1|nr:VWA domain-containing protein [Mesobacillus selenatarsenatis]GAM14723.1 D-amino acid dehydrogenase large subunit [Mesobacillus selenatarsenatis SF-1]
MKRYSLLLFLITSLALSACSSDEPDEEVVAEQPAKEVVKKEETKQSKFEHLKNISLEVTEESLMALKSGSMMGDLSYEKDIEDIGFNTPELDPELKNMLPAKLEELSNQTDDLETIKKGLVSMLASPHYKEIIENASAYEPHFEEPFLPDPTKTDGGEETKPAEKAIILLDASSSMLQQADGRVKMEIAKDAVKSFAKTIGQFSEVSLLVYGHKGSDSDADKGVSCSGIEEVYPMGKYAKEEFHGAVDSFESKGWTPLAGAIQKAGEMSSSYDGNTTIYIVSDGAETCDGDPVQTSKDLIAKNTDSSVNIIGFDVDGEAENQLKAVAEAGNGEYFKADNPEELKNTIQYEWLPSTLDLAFAFTMAPDGWDMVAEYKIADKYPLELWTVGRKEAHRIIDAAAIMSENGWITDEQYSELRDWGFERSEAMKELHYAMSKTNREKADTESKEIRQRVDDWVAKMKELKKERGDTW